ncbi:MAG TPA: AAA family ATPase [Phycisphaerae bacterium]|nr:AAA family ATPase [Phycisphaerae bacterium]HRW54605.1 AAA family ATPase [Phycisphaerae bacterium]
MRFRFNEIHLQNVLSFGPDSPALTLENLNVFIGPNGSGKSNLLEVINLLRCCPSSIAKPIRETGGIGYWVWKGIEGTIAQLSIQCTYLDIAAPVRHDLGLAGLHQQMEVANERIGYARPTGKEFPFYLNNGNGAEIFLSTRVPELAARRISAQAIKNNESILSQRKAPDEYPEVTKLGVFYQQIQMYREWSVGRGSLLRRPHPADLPNDFLSEKLDNLGLVLNRIGKSPKSKKRLIENLRKLYNGIDDYHVDIAANHVQVFLTEGDFTIPATRLSDGTLRYLCLLAILCHPEPPPVICIEEPEIGLHPDILPAIADLLKLASEKSQLFVTTHSDILVDALTDTPQSIVVCEKENGSTTMKRLEPEKLSEWLEKYRLGELWMKGEIGGNRW